MWPKVLIEGDFAGAVYVVDGRRVAEYGEQRAVLPKRRLRTVAAAHERLAAAEPCAPPGPIAHLLLRHRPGAVIPRVLPERTIAAPVAAEVGDRQKDLWGERDHAALRAVAERAGVVAERLNLAVVT